MRNRVILGAAFAALLPAAAVAEDSVAAASAPATVDIRAMKFEPAILTVAPGTTVTWTNDDNSPHTVTDRGRVFRSAAIDKAGSFSYTFATPGEFTYFCTLHPMMVGKIVVKLAGSSS